MSAIQYIISRLQIISVLLCMIILTGSLISYHWYDQSYLYQTSKITSVHNWFGSWGAELAALLHYFLGISCWGINIILALYMIGMLCPAATISFRLLWSALILTTVSIASVMPYQAGIVGRSTLYAIEKIIDKPLISFFLVLSWMVIVILLIGYHWVRPFIRAMRYCFQILMKSNMVVHMQTVINFYTQSLKKKIAGGISQQTIDTEDDLEKIYQRSFWQPYISSPDDNLTNDQSETAPAPEQGSYELPDIQKLFKYQKSEPLKQDRFEQNQAHILEEKLQRFGIRGKVVSIMVGPVVTLFEYQPDIDIPLNKIIAREDDLALALEALSLRVIAPIPGKSVIGFEVAHTQRKTVYFSDCIKSLDGAQKKLQLPLALGQDTMGNAVMIDLATLPHLLVAGSTGSGKSVALNSMLVTLLCHKSPCDLKLVLIDPKRLEFACYADIPQLVFPVITDAKMAIAALNWAVRTMEERYERMATYGVRTLQDYRALNIETMPLIVIVIDELADLMMIAGKDVEYALTRLAHMARAAGIHLVVATQRPSVDVVTGVIKVNFPARIACKVISKVDSRTILDTVGAEKLLGKGDMLFLNTQGTIHRLHGAYITDAEIKQVVDYLKSQQSPHYEELFEQSEEQGLQPEDEKLYQELVQYVKSLDEISISLLQRRFRIGYNRSARMIELLESRGVILPASGGKTRKVLR